MIPKHGGTNIWSYFWYHCLCVLLWVTEKSCMVRTALLWNITCPAFNKIAVQSHCLCGHINRDAWYKTCTAAVGRTSDIFVRCCCRILHTGIATVMHLGLWYVSKQQQQVWFLNHCSVKQPLMSCPGKSLCTIIVYLLYRQKHPSGSAYCHFLCSIINPRSSLAVKPITVSWDLKEV